MTQRLKLKNGSNNPKNPNKNVCGLAVAKALKVDDTVHYLHTMEDIVRATRNKYTVRSRSSKFRGRSVGGSRERFSNEADRTRDKEGAAVYGFILRVKSPKGSSHSGHAIFVDAYGDTCVDTAVRKRDRRKITHAYVVYRPVRRGVEIFPKK